MPSTSTMFAGRWSDIDVAKYTNGAEDPRETTRLEGLTRRLRRWAGNPAVGLLLLLAGLGVVGVRLADSAADARTVVAEADPAWIGAAAGFYGLGLLALSGGIAITLGVGRFGLVGALESQLLKYVPGSIWQATHAFSQASWGGVVGYAAVVVGSASVALVVSGNALLAVAGAVAALLLFVLGVRRMGPARSSLAAGAAISCAVLIGLSGWALSHSMGLGAGFGAATAGAWGIGALAVPVPAGLGVRDAAITMLADAPEADLLAFTVVHRLLSLAVDVVVGVAGVLGIRMLASGPNVGGD